MRYLYQIYGFSLIVQFSKLFGNFSFFDVIIVSIFLLDRRKIAAIFSDSNLKILYKICAFSTLASFTLTSISNPLASDNINYYIQYIFCLFIALPVFTLTFQKKNVQHVCKGIFLGSNIAVILLYNNYTGNLPQITNHIFNFSVTGGIFYRTGLIAVNDFAVIVISCMIYMNLWNSSRVLKLFTFLLLSLLLVYTGSRVGLVIGIAFLLFIIPRIWIGPIFLIICSAIYWLIHSVQNNPILRIVTLGLSDTQRSDMVSRAIEVLNTNLLGVGLGEYIDQTTGYPVHNFYLLNLVEQGFFQGWIFIMSIVGIAIYSLLNSQYRYQKVVIFLHLLGLMVITHGFDRFFWIIFALGLQPFSRTQFPTKTDDPQFAKPIHEKHSTIGRKYV